MDASFSPVVSAGATAPATGADLLAGALERLVMDEPLRRAMGNAGRSRAHREFSLERMIENYETFYRGLAMRRIARAQ